MTPYSIPQDQCCLSNLEAVVVSNDDSRDRISYLSITLMKEKVSQESIQPSTTPDPGYQWESIKLTTRHHKREPRGQPFPSRYLIFNLGCKTLILPMLSNPCCSLVVLELTRMVVNMAHINRRIQGSFSFDSYLNMSYQTYMCLDPHQK